MLTVSYNRMARKGHALVDSKEKGHKIKIMAHEALHVKDACGKLKTIFVRKVECIANGKVFK